MLYRRFLPSFVGLLAAFGCASVATTSASPVRVVLQADRETVAPGESVRFVAEARNPSDARIRIGDECGPPLDVLVTLPGGASHSVAAATMGADGAFTCGGNSRHVVEPGDSSVVTLQWVAPQQRGEYLARAGVRGSTGFSHMSDPVRLVVR